jgi:hypothetical protein
VVPDLPDVPREWRELAARDPKALEHARALTARVRDRWPDRKPSDEECWADETCAHHILVLEAIRAGGLANLMAPFLDEDVL